MTPAGDTAAPALARPAVARAALADAAFLASVSVLSLGVYVGKLGFYLDDYSFLRILESSRDRSFFTLYDNLYSEATKTQLRPVQVALLAGLYKLFGANPHPYHLFNAAVLVCGVVLLYLLLRELGLSRPAAVAAGLLYTTLPHFSSDRFWVAAFQANLSMTLCFAGLYAAVRALRATRHRPAWAVLAIAASVASVLAYEVSLPFFFLVPLFAARGRRRLAAAVTFLVIGAAVAAKVVVAVRIGHESSYHLGFGGGFVHHVAYLVSGGLKLNAGTYGVFLPYVVGWVLAHALTWTIAVLTLVAGAAVYAYFARAGEAPPPREGKVLAGAGIVVFVLGYAVFLTNSEISFSSATVDNRVNIAAAVGVALLLAAAVVRVAAAAPAHLRHRVFAIGMSALSMSGFLIVNALASFWIRAAHRQDAVLAAVQARVPAARTLLLDGVCPEIGPAIVFTTQYDLTGALFLRLHDPALNAAVLTPYVRVGRRSLEVSNYFGGRRTSLRTYPYGPRSFVYDYEHGSVYRLADEAAARRYFRTVRTPLACPPIRSFRFGLPSRLAA